MTAAAPGFGSRTPLLGPAEFARFRGLIYRETGIHLTECKEALLVGRLAKRLRALGLTTFGAYWRLVADGGDPQERLRMLEAVCTHETRFFREPQHWAFLADDLFPRWRTDAAARQRPRRVRAWSAGCSTGEEPYTLAMMLLEHFPATEGWQVEVLATDFSSAALAHAEEGLWPIEKAEHIPAPLRRKYWLKGRRSQEGRMAAGPELRGAVRFEQLNLNDDAYSLAGRFDLVFCRNVLIYFDAVSRAAVVGRLLDRLEDDGHLFLGHAESLSHVTDRAASVIPTVYKRLPPRAPTGAAGR
ncbi:MAG TPA: protein-glutamate O-methyltransferase CheR [Longimicrobiaceae bacterium]|nr:protein-glutamate O-methyltransferase CheR [Longimicrobiaceae bacterium]